MINQATRAQTCELLLLFVIELGDSETNHLEKGSSTQDDLGASHLVVLLDEPWGPRMLGCLPITINCILSQGTIFCRFLKHLEQVDWFHESVDLMRLR